MSGGARVFFYAAVLAAPAFSAAAHAPLFGAEETFLGVSYPLATPPQALLLLGLSVMVGSFETDQIKTFLAVFFAAMAIGLIAVGGGFFVHAAMLGAALGAAMLAALAPGRLRPAALAMVGIGGVLFGASALGPGPLSEQLVVFVGTVAGAGVGLLTIAVFVDLVMEKVPWPWVRIVFRVAAAWIAAISLLLLALLLSR